MAPSMPARSSSLCVIAVCFFCVGPGELDSSVHDEDASSSYEKRTRTLLLPKTVSDDWVPTLCVCVCCINE